MIVMVGGYSWFVILHKKDFYVIFKVYLCVKCYIVRELLRYVKVKSKSRGISLYLSEYVNDNFGAETIDGNKFGIITVHSNFSGR